MKKIRLFVCLTILLWGISSAIGQAGIFGTQCDPCAPACDPCEPVCDPCDPCGSGGSSSLFTLGGWIDMGVYTNSRGFNNNGPMHASSTRRNDFVLSQLYLSAAKEMDTRRGLDWGARADFVYGAHADGMQTGDGTFDAGWGMNRSGYAVSAYQLYGTLGYHDLSVKVGKFGTPVGWEGSASKDNFFYSHSYCYWIEPATHMGILADYKLSDRLTISAGWTTGADSSFDNPYGKSALLTGFEYALADDATVYYWINAGKTREDYNEWTDYFVQSLCFELALTDRFTYVNQYNLRNDNVRGGDRTSAYGINNHFLYKLNDQWSVGTRFEWLRDNCGYVTDDTSDYYQVTLGLNWNPWENVSIRPEVRYDWCRGGVTPFGPSAVFGDYPIQGIRSEQVSGGCGIVLSF